MRSLSVLLLLLPSPIPLEPGSWWEYRESYTEHLAGLDSTTDEVTRFEVRGSPEQPFLHQSGGFDPSSGPIERSEGWIRLAPWTGEEPLPLPLVVGAEGPHEERAGWRVEAEEEVRSPAGTFPALRCAIRTPTHVSILWISPGIGVIRQTEGAPDSHPDLERILVRFHASREASGRR